MRIAAYQGPVAFRGWEANLAATLDALAKADDAGAQILCMPETFLHGYFPAAAEARAHSVDLQSDFFADLLRRVAGYSPTLLLGLNERRGEALYNTQVVIENGRLLGRYSKNYLVFNYFERGHEFPVFERDGVTYGIIICADSSYVEPARILAMRGAQVIFSPHFNFIPYAGVDRHTRKVRACHVARAVENEVFVIKANVIVPKAQGSPHFRRQGVGVGDNFVVDPDGQFIAEAGQHTERLLIVDLDEDRMASERRSLHRVDAAIAGVLAAEYERITSERPIEEEN